jgi:formate dehydrogenase subunit beta
MRQKVEGAMLRLGEKWRRRDFTALRKDPWKIIERETSRCIKCYSCIENCPVCFTTPRSPDKKSFMVESGTIPPNPMFHLRRFSHISDTCVNCGQCEELCPMQIPLALFSHAIRVEGDAVFQPKLGPAPYKN